VLVCFALMVDGLDFARGMPPAARGIYPLLMAALLAGFGRRFGQRFSFVAGLLILSGWFAVAGWRGYIWLRQIVVGLDQMLWSLALFAVAVLVSLAKSGVRPRWFLARRSALARLQQALDAPTGEAAWPSDAAVPPSAVRPARDQVREEEP
jgi:hypothetical protein